MRQNSRAKRDDFPEIVKRELAKRVNYNCSLCHAPTSGPQTGSDRSFSVGKAAHIKAAAPGGPRYDPDQSREARRGIHNGIWCCSVCADIVDRDPAAYSVEELHRLKDEAEHLARHRVGRTPISALPAVVTPSSIKEAVDQFCRKEAARQEQLDPRFKTSVTWGASGPIYELKAIDPVAAQIFLKTEDKQRQALQDVFDYGGTGVFENIAFQIEGSPLFPGPEAANRLQISTQGRRVNLIAAVEEGSGLTVYLDFSGEATYGNKGLRFKGEAFAGMLIAELTADHQSPSASFSFHFEVQKWARTQMLRLPYFDRLKEVVTCLSRPAPVQLRLAWADKEIELGSATVDVTDYLRGFRAFLYEVEILRKLDKFFKLDLMMPADLDDILRDQGDIDGLLSLIEIQRAESQEISATIIPAEPADDLIRTIEQQQPGAIRVSHPTTLFILGKSYGPFQVDVACPQAVIVPVGPVKIAPGQEVRLLLRAAGSHRWVSTCSPIPAAD